MKFFVNLLNLVYSKPYKIVFSSDNTLLFDIYQNKLRYDPTFVNFRHKNCTGNLAYSDSKAFGYGSSVVRQSLFAVSIVRTFFMNHFLDASIDKIYYADLPCNFHLVLFLILYFIT